MRRTVAGVSIASPPLVHYYPSPFTQRPHRLLKAVCFRLNEDAICKK